MRKLLERLSSGDEKAFDKAFMIYFPKLRFFLSGLLADDDEAENLAQEIFYRLWRNRSTLSGVSNLNAYIFKMAKNAALNHIERHNLRQTAAEKLKNKASESKIDEADEILIANEMLLTINQTIAQMPPQRREVFRLSRLQGLSNEEIADQLSISKRTVETHISAALSDIRKGVVDANIN